MSQSCYFQTKDLTVGYNGVPLIKHINLAVQRGEIVTLIGPNGSGKSTILKTLTRHLKPISGTVLIDGDDLQHIPYRTLATKVAVVLTERIRTELMTCWDVVASGRYPYTGRMGILTAEDREKVVAALETVRAADLAERDFSAISDGQRQRILLARAICQEPEIIVLDEPTSFLDIRHKLDLLSTLRSMAKERGITVILSLHEIELAEKVSDRLVCVKGDHISHAGSPAEIFREEIIRPLYELDEHGFNVLFGSVELPRPQGVPQVFVLSGGGSGIPVFRQLQKENIPFAAGILQQNDVDFQVAKALAHTVISERPFSPVSDAALDAAKQQLLSCKKLICTDYPQGPQNARLQELIDFAGQNGIPCEHR